jgi:hypothetical protein
MSVNSEIAIQGVFCHQKRTKIAHAIQGSSSHGLREQRRSGELIRPENSRVVWIGDGGHKKRQRAIEPPSSKTPTKTNVTEFWLFHTISNLTWWQKQTPTTVAHPARGGEEFTMPKMPEKRIVYVVCAVVGITVIALMMPLMLLVQYLWQHPNILARGLWVTVIRRAVWICPKHSKNLCSTQCVQ